jgi:hypothetical protein
VSIWSRLDQVWKAGQGSETTVGPSGSTISDTFNMRVRATGCEGRKNFDICRFRGVTFLARTSLWKPWAFANNNVY